MSRNPWLSMGIGYSVLIICTAIVLLIPETFHLSQGPQASASRTADFHVPSTKLNHLYLSSKTAASASLDQIKKCWRVITHSRNVTLIIVADIFATLAVISQFYSLQYISERYGVPIKTVNYLTSFRALVTLVLFLVVLPAIDKLLRIRIGVSSSQKDLILARASMIFGILAFLVLAFAPVFWVVIISTLLLCAYGSFGPFQRALITSLVPQETIGTLYTAQSMLATLAGLFGSPAFAVLLGLGVKLGGALHGLPYIIASSMIATSFGVMLFVRLPVKRLEDEEEESLLVGQDEM
jgi:hypothetical protein